jgi:serine/threonine-protein kinase
MFRSDELPPDSPGARAAATCARCGHELERNETCLLCVEADAAAAEAGLVPGAVFVEKYRVIESLGGGSFGFVLKVEHILLKETFALKLLRPELLASDAARRRFFREAKVACRFSHANAVTIRDFGIGPGEAPYMALDLARGEPLTKAIAAGPIPPARAAAIMRQVLDGVAAAHAAGIVHRDLKPSNLLVERLRDGRDVARVLDFGLARIIDETAGSNDATNRATTTGRVIGTLGYLAPEQAAGAPVDERADIYACGIILYEMLSGASPYGDVAPHELLTRAATMRVPPLRESASALAIPRDLEAVVMRAVEKVPNDRYQTAAEFRDALAGLFSSRLPGILASDEPKDGLRAPASGRRAALAAIAGICLLLLAASLVARGCGRGGSASPPAPGSASRGR